MLEDGFVLHTLAGEEGQLARHQRRLEQARFLRHYALCGGQWITKLCITFAEMEATAGRRYFVS